MTDKTGTGSNVFATSPTLNAPILNIGINAQTGTTFQPALSDAGALVTLNNASAIAVTIPTNATVAFAYGATGAAQLNFAWITSAGQPTISGAGGVTIISTAGTPSAPKLRVVNSVATAIQIALNTWLVTGDIV